MGLGIYLWWKLDQPIVATGNEAKSIVRKRFFEIPESAKDVYYVMEGFQDHQTYISFSLPNNEAENFLFSVVRERDPSAVLISASTSEIDYVNRGPERKPKKWGQDFWNLGSITDGVMYEKERWFGCVDRHTGRIYLCIRS